MDSAIETIEFLARSAHRVGVLEELADGPRSRADLRAATGASSPTMGRVLSGFEAERWIVRDGSTYSLTPLGEFVATRFLELRDAMETERKLQAVWQWLPREMEGFSVDLFADAVVSHPGPGYPYEPVERLTQLIQRTSRLRGFDSIVFKSINNETVCRAVLDGMELEYVYSPAALEGTLAWNPERVLEAASQENCRVYVHDDLPDGNRCGLGIADDRVGICCHDVETGALTAVVDTAAPEARAWAIATFERIRQEATPVDPQAFDTLDPSDHTTVERTARKHPQP
ncbi:helix-turn-helix transcriptional regulator [Halorarius litoreus]|uniref:helix-turn-helix transcriptional regulator n=1 Tax=Halorarius litoreus TaxID=2962676 RepID=UPI0020CBAA16|nr:transcriptional regulator [Halorarius litoreus]